MWTRRRTRIPATTARAARTTPAQTGSIRIRTVSATSGDLDDDGDGVPDASDSAPLNAFVCGLDLDIDLCDDCSSGTNNTATDGLDSDGDGLCNVGDLDDDGDGVADATDSAPLDPLVCGLDVDVDTCDDCASGTNDASNDGLDTDTDGLCDLGDLDDDGDGVPDATDSAPLDPNVCGLDVDADTCDDCASGSNDPANDGLDFDTDGLCDAGDLDDDGDGVPDASDSAPLDANVCGLDVDVDTCDDCASGSNDPANDGFDTDADGLCDPGDLDDDGDGVPDAGDSAPLDPNVCGLDVDTDTCDDCANGFNDAANDGLDTDSDGACDLGDLDDDGDGVPRTPATPRRSTPSSAGSMSTRTPVTIAALEPTTQRATGSIRIRTVSATPAISMTTATACPMPATPSRSIRSSAASMSTATPATTARVERTIPRTTARITTATASATPRIRSRSPRCRSGREAGLLVLISMAGIGLMRRRSVPGGMRAKEALRATAPRPPSAKRRFGHRAELVATRDVHQSDRRDHRVPENPDSAPMEDPAVAQRLLARRIAFPEIEFPMPEPDECARQDDGQCEVPRRDRARRAGELTTNIRVADRHAPSPTCRGRPPRRSHPRS